MGFAKLPVLSVHHECVDYVPLHSLKEHPLWNVLNNDEFFRGTNQLSNQRTNGPVNAHLISGPRMSTKYTKPGKNKVKK